MMKKQLLSDISNRFLKSVRLLLTLGATSFLMSLSILAQNKPNDTKSKMTRFKIEIPQVKLDEINRRVGDYKFSTAISEAGWKYGIDPEYLKRLVAFWRAEYDWRKTEREINRFQHYRATIDNRKIQFIYEKGSGKNPQPLLILHGFPYSSISYLKIIEPLAHPERFGGRAEDGFDVIVPDLPGFGFSDAPADLRGLRFFAGQMRRLMTEVLGYDKFIVQGGDMGDHIGVWMALDHPENIFGLHENGLAIRNAEVGFNIGETKGAATAEERDFLKREHENAGRESAYAMLQGSRSITLAAAMADSPVGQAAWIIEKYYYWSDKTQKPFEQIYSMEHLLDEVMYYLATDSFETAIRPYAAFGKIKGEDLAIPDGKKLTVPIAFGVFPNDGLLLTPPRSLMERSRSNIVQWTGLPRGGHFPFLEEPLLFVEDVRNFGRVLRSRKTEQ